MTSSPPAPDPARPAAEQLGLAARALLDLDRLELARAVAQAGLETDPALGNLHSVMGGILEAMGEDAAALPYWREAVRLMPNSPQQRLNLALALLGRGDFAEGLEAYEARRAKEDWIAMATRASMQAQWERRLKPGEDVAGKSVLVLTEQGLGDAIMFARYLPMLVAVAGKVTVVCKPALRPLFERMEGIGEVVSPPADQPHARINLGVAQFDAWTPLMSLPQWFATAQATLPPPIALRADPAAVAGWRARYDAAGRPGRRRIGLVFRANPESASAPQRSMRIDDLRPLGNLPVDLVNLQPGPEGRALTAALPNVIEAMDREVPLDQFAAAVAATDLLVTVDTMAAHCAGALGHPTWVAIPYGPHWYWRAEAPWYPRLRILRQTRRHQWHDVVAAIMTGLAG